MGGLPHGEQFGFELFDDDVQKDKAPVSVFNSHADLPDDGET